MTSCEVYRPKILVVDDDQEMRQLLDDVLTREGFHVAQAANGSEALVAIRGTAYNVIVLDKIMTDMSGLEILPEIKRLQPGAQVILITAFGDRETGVEAIGKGATAYLAKPFGISVLVQMVKKVLEQKIGEA
ncbi:response regulator [Candidatus Methylomirabilis sp.]|uniref:response regulator n=1 Tax=Candidatus Methylomirabilis sp. TaxID=2032687 RepID=UPI002A5D054B|nr:response regulator [Candidatus Methylomirabilis sp.]